MSAVLTEEYNVTVNSDELIRTTDYLNLLTRFRVNRRRYKRVRLYVVLHRYYILQSIDPSTFE